MPKKVQKTLQDYLAKVKSPRHSSQNQSQKPFNSFSFFSSKNWIIAACKHPRTPSFAFDDSHGGGRGGNNSNNHKDDAATLADVDRFLYENFKSLYFREGEENEDYNTSNKRVDSSGQIQHDQGAKLIPMFDSLRLAETPRDLGGSNRFFVKTGLSGSLFLDDGLTRSGDDHHYAGSSSNSTVTNTDSSSNDENHHENEKLPENCIALLRSSSSPYEDFRRSMQDVVEARFKSHGKVIDWEFMEELLLSYLRLNEKKSHKFILNAFVDVTAAMRPNSEMTDPHPRSVRTVRFGRGVAKKTKEFTLEFGSSNS
ncbi:hypothetical protein HN51_042562 [Arachis hypogaea]|uniref:Transcription repressor n=1 Tax=Arachis hypogaea TaxID=3818 RepID=A0A445CIH7_ARAHY|nr:transcription repressor OFP14 [Arachis hypogaea]XP_025670878.1 transcription repressor OFP14 [Arachis hypogaea]RYR50733.1 hypothetical protein Ahy_A07g037358 [Arachis hypogaea]